MPGRTGFVREKARKTLKDAGQNSVPVDLEKVCEYLGFRYIEVQNFPTSLSALCIEQGGMKYAAVNASHHPHRKRFSLAHELGHWVLGHTRSYARPDVSIDNPPEPEDIIKNNAIEESEANEFAGELLVPLAQLKKHLSQTPDIEKLAAIFNVSTQDISIRLLATRSL